MKREKKESPSIQVDWGCAQRNYRQKEVCGDTLACRVLSEGSRLVVVLADGMGHGEQAQKLSAQVSSMILEALSTNQNMREIGKKILQQFSFSPTAPYQYSTFTLLDIYLQSGQVTIINHDNPPSLVMRNGEPLQTEWTCLVMTAQNEREQTVLMSRFKAERGDRIILVTDGITQSGLNSSLYPLGWNSDNLTLFICEKISQESGIRAESLANEILSAALHLDEGVAKDDMSCFVAQLI